MAGADAAFLRLREIRKKTGRDFISVMAGWGRLDSGRERILGENGFWARTDSGRERILGENGLRVKIKMKTSAKTAGAKRRWLSLKQEAMKSGNPLHGFMASCFIYFQTEPLPAKRR
jgi:hypothetical protein